MSKLNYYIKSSFDYEINKDYNNLVKYLNTSGYYKSLTNKKRSRIDSLKILGEIGNTTIHLKHTPDRKSINLLKNKKDIDYKLEKKCPLCQLTKSNLMIYPLI